ncbi:hypothetical protein OG615_41675 [Streptomyces virginiae]
MAAKAADASGDTATRVWIRGRAVIALGYEGAALPIGDVLADQAISISDRPPLGGRDLGLFMVWLRYVPGRRVRGVPVVQRSRGLRRSRCQQAPRAAVDLSPDTRQRQCPRGRMHASWGWT